MRPISANVNLRVRNVSERGSHFVDLLQYIEQLAGQMSRYVDGCLRSIQQRHFKQSSILVHKPLKRDIPVSVHFFINAVDFFVLRLETYFLHKSPVLLEHTVSYFRGQVLVQLHLSLKMLLQ